MTTTCTAGVFYLGGDSHTVCDLNLGVTLHTDINLHNVIALDLGVAVHNDIGLDHDQVHHTRNLLVDGTPVFDHRVLEA